jgi:hypothetical protein
MTSTENALERLYPGVDPWRLSPDPLDGVSIYRRADHWHFISDGMSEWGYELTFRLADSDRDSTPPTWAASFLANLARYVLNSGNSFAAGHHMDLNGPISLDHPDTAIRAIAFTEDPELRDGFLQIVGLTLDEYAAIEAWDSERLLEALAPHLKWLVTDLERPSLTTDIAVATAIAAGIRRDGSSTGSVYVEHAAWAPDDDGVTVTFGASAAPRVSRMLGARVPYGRGLLVDSPAGAIRLRPGDHTARHDDVDGVLAITLTPDALDELVTALRSTHGEHRMRHLPDLTVRVVRSQIRDANGEIVAEIG